MKLIDADLLKEKIRKIAEEERKEEPMWAAGLRYALTIIDSSAPVDNEDLISRSYLKNLPFERMIHTDFGETAIPIEEINNAPPVE